MKKFLLIPLVIALAAALIFGGCAAPAPAEPAAPAAPEVITLRYSSQQPTTGWDVQHAAGPMLQKIEAATGGAVEFETYYGATLNAPPEAWEAVKSGVADMAWTWALFTPGMTSLADVVTLPFMPFKSAEQASGILWKLYEEFPSLAEQYKDNKILFVWVTTPYFLINSKRPVETMEDLAGLKIRVGGGPPTEQMILLGATPVGGIGMPATYENLQKGVIDGMAIPAEALYSFRQYEVVKYYTYVPLHATYFAYAMNWDTWDSLSADIQEAIMSVCGLEGSAWYGENMFDTIEVEALEVARASGYPMEEYTLPASELARWTEIAGEPLWAQWVADREAEGLTDAQAVLDTCLELIETYNP